MLLNRREGNAKKGQQEEERKTTTQGGMTTSGPAPPAGSIWTNPSASSFQCDGAADHALIQRFHASLEGFHPTPLLSLDDLAAELGVRAVYVKDESSRLSLPAFKILGASWGTFRAVASRLGAEPGDVDLAGLAGRAREARIALVTATDGNHGRAVARMARLMGLEARVHVPEVVDQPTADLSAGEGARVLRVAGNYDVAVAAAARDASTDPRYVLVQDTSFPGYEDIPAWIVQGYSTMLVEATASSVHRPGSRPR